MRTQQEIRDLIMRIWTRYTHCLRDGHNGQEDYGYCLNCGKDKK